MSSTSSYRHGRIIFAYLRGSVSGKMERHPAVILDPDENITQPSLFDPRKTASDNVVRVIGVSTKHKRYSVEYVQLPFSATGHAVTKLRESCGAILGWYHRIVIPDDVIGFGGDVPTAAMREIDNLVRADLVKRMSGEFTTFKQVFDELFSDGE